MLSYCLQNIDNISSVKSSFSLYTHSIVQYQEYMSGLCGNQTVIEALFMWCNSLVITHFVLFPADLCVLALDV